MTVDEVETALRNSPKLTDKWLKRGSEQRQTMSAARILAICKPAELQCDSRKSVQRRQNPAIGNLQPEILAMRVYLTGPITGHSDKEIENWRTTVARQLESLAEVVDPAAYSYDNSLTFRTGETPEGAVTRLHHGQFVIERNKKLICDSDVVLANFLGASERASIGSIGELFWANAFDKPIIIIREKQGNVHDHAMVNAIAAIICSSLDEAVAAVGELAGSRSKRKRAGGN